MNLKLVYLWAVLALAALYGFVSVLGGIEAIHTQKATRSVRNKNGLILSSRTLEGEEAVGQGWTDIIFGALIFTAACYPCVKTCISHGKKRTHPA